MGGCLVRWCSLWLAGLAGVADDPARPVAAAAYTYRVGAGHASVQHGVERLGRKGSKRRAAWRKTAATRLDVGGAMAAAPAHALHAMRSHQKMKAQRIERVAAVPWMRCNRQRDDAGAKEPA